MTDTLKPFRKYFRWAAFACSLASAVLTLHFGLAQSDQMLIALACAAFLVACSLASDYINLFVVDAWRGGNKAMCATFAIGAAFVFSLNLLSNLGSVGWQRDAVATAATVQNTKYDDSRDQVSEGKASLAMWEVRLAKLEAENAWSATVTAEALRAQLASANLAIDLEAKRGGCKALCLARTKERDDIASKIAIAEETGTLRKQIEATKAVLASHRAKAANTEAVTAAPVSQAAFFASMVSLDLKPSDTSKTWTDRGIASWLALGLCVAPILFGLIGWKSSADEDHMDPPPSAKAPVTTYKPLVGIPAEPIHVHTTDTVHIKDATLRRWSLSDEVQAMLQGGLKAA